MRNSPQALRNAEISNKEHPSATSVVRSLSGNDVAPPRLAYSVAEAATVSSISRSKLYELVKSGVLDSIKISGRRLIRRSDLLSLLQMEAE